MGYPRGILGAQAFFGVLRGMSGFPEELLGDFQCPRGIWGAPIWIWGVLTLFCGPGKGGLVASLKRLCGIFGVPWG